MAAASADGSLVAFDFFSEALIRENKVRIGTALLDLIGEPLLFGIDACEGVKTGLAAVMAETGFELSELRVVESWIGERFKPAYLSGHVSVLGGLAIAQKVSPQ